MDAHTTTNRSRRFTIPAAALLVLAGLCLPLHAAIDRLELRGKEPVLGLFLGFRNGRFAFQTAQGERLNPRTIHVEKLSVEPPIEVTLALRGGRTHDKIPFLGYRDARFVFHAQDEDITHPVTLVQEIDIGLAFRRFTPPDTPSDEEAEEPQGLARYVKPGAVTILHFHMPDVMASVRQGNYVKSLAREGRTRVRIVQIDIADWGSEEAREFDIRSVPQFWFFDRKGKPVTKLVERFTGEDIDRALKDAARR